MQDRNPAANLSDAILRQQEVVASILKHSAPFNWQHQVLNPILAQFLESVKFQQKIIAESIIAQSQVPVTLNRVIARQLASSAIDIVSQMFSSTAWVNQFAQINVQFSEHISQITPRIADAALPWLSPVIELVGRVGEASSIRDAFLHYNLWIAPSMSEELIGKVLDSYRRGLNSGTVHNMLVQHYARNDWKTLDEVIERCKRNPLFKGRLQLIDEALGTHRSGWYSSSVSLLLMQLEGIAADYVNKHNLMPQLGGKTKEIILAAVRNTPCSLSDVREYAGINALIGYLQKSMYISMDFDKEYVRLQKEGRLLAHPIRHGRQVKFGTRMNSLRLFLILDVLSLLDT